MDGTRNESGYLCRGEWELEPYMECLWYLFSKIPSIVSPGMTVLDETVKTIYPSTITPRSTINIHKGRFDPNVLLPELSIREDSFLLKGQKPGIV